MMEEERRLTLYGIYRQAVVRDHVHRLSLLHIVLPSERGLAIP